MTITAGIDVGTSSVKVALLNVSNPLAYGNDAKAEILALRSDRIRKRIPSAVAVENYRLALSDASLSEQQVDYVASTGDGENVEFRRGHFYGMTTHARGALFLVPDATAVLDIGALHARAISMDLHARVLNHRMTSQCASGSGQFLENIARYLGVTLEEVGELSVQAKSPEVVSGICAVLAETDVINMVSRGIKTGDILKGIHASMAGRLVKLLGMIGARNTIALSGGLAADKGLVLTIEEDLKRTGSTVRIVSHPQAIYAGAIGAALWGAYRHEKLLQRSAVS